ncbi:hypothetical protein [Cytobacillus purgationiresistens]|uniref:Sporulation protein YjcZ n=1 Tax=Cytobacillus purgationiresistens TaxID=863449 RepID=A0ABU0AM09_9BACI|nr:hypothetical protein [Cytobacillus purgationiresistens]MDQ0272307.1 hypothetical protein [Cytobacillus purgationiresistens]
MSGYNHYERCRGGIGRPVEVRMHDGRIHRGIIDRVSRDRVYLRPMGRNYGGYGYWGWGFGAGFAFGAIATLAFLPLFFW